MPKNNLKKGFTLIELLVVISIIAFLLSAGTVVLVNMRAKSRDAQRYSDLSEIKKALDMYYQENGSYPVSSGWQSVCAGYTTSGPSGWIPNLAPKYMLKLPVNPTGCVGGSIKGYIYISNGVDYKAAADWSADLGELCGIGKEFYDSRCGGATRCQFCSVYTPGYKDR